MQEPDAWDCIYHAESQREEGRGGPWARERWEHGCGLTAEATTAWFRRRVDRDQAGGHTDTRSSSSTRYTVASHAWTCHGKPSCPRNQRQRAAWAWLAAPCMTADHKGVDEGVVCGGKCTSQAPLRQRPVTYEHELPSSRTAARPCAPNKTPMRAQTVLVPQNPLRTARSGKIDDGHLRYALSLSLCLFFFVPFPSPRTTLLGTAPAVAGHRAQHRHGHDVTVFTRTSTPSIKRSCSSVVGFRN